MWVICRRLTERCPLYYRVYSALLGIGVFLSTTGYRGILSTTGYSILSAYSPLLVKTNRCGIMECMYQVRRIMRNSVLSIKTIRTCSGSHVLLYCCCLFHGLCTLYDTHYEFVVQTKCASHRRHNVTPSHGYIRLLLAACCTAV